MLTGQHQTPMRFTLTMWDVKELGERVIIRDKDMFYLNYVGCKVRL